MELQRRLLRAMLWMLALAAGAGVLAIFASTRVMGRVAGTAFVAAIAVALAMPVARYLDDEKKRMGGLVGLGILVLSLILALAAIWIDLFALGGDVEWKLAGTSLLVCVAGLLASTLLGRAAPREHRWARDTGLAADALAFACLAGAIWISYPLNQKLGQTGWFVLSSGLVGAVALIGVPATGRLWQWLGVLGAGAGLVLGLLGVWVVPPSDPTVYVVVMCTGAAVAYANVVLRIPLGASARWARPVAIGSVGGTALCIILLSASTGGFEISPSDLLVRITGALGIVSACATLGLVILYRLNRRPESARMASVRGAAIALACPHCGRKQTVPEGESACAGCGLLFTITIREPLCAACGYPLLGIKGGVCPECGAPRRIGPAPSDVDLSVVDKPLQERDRQGREDQPRP